MMAKQVRVLGWVAVSSTMQIGEDKFSLEKQEADIRQLCQQNEWELIALLKVPGFSRDYDNIIEASDAMRAEGITAFDDLRRHIERRTFDLLICRDADRFGRTLSLVAEVTAKIRRIGAQIYTLAGGLVDDKGATMWSAFAGLKAQSDIERLVDYGHAGKKKNAERGIPAGRKPPQSHLVIRNELGKRVKLVPDESKRRLFEDAADILLQGVGWRFIEKELAQRGHVSPETGRAFTGSTMYFLFHTPVFWGNTGYGFRRGHKRHCGLWAFDPDVPPPPEATIYYDTHEAMLTGDLGARTKDELWRRHGTIKGGASSRETGAFTGLIVCHDCGYTTSRRYGRTAEHRQIEYYGCARTQSCPGSRGYIRIEGIQQQLNDKFLKPLFEGVTLDALLTPSGDPLSATRRQIELIEVEIETVRREIPGLIRLQLKYPDMEEQYAGEIRQTRQRLDTLETRLEELRRREQASGIRESQRAAVEELRAVYDRFWQQDNRTINQLLHRLLGRWRFVMKDREITELREP